MNSKKAILGGTFSPLHKGHIELALKVKESFSFNEIIFLLSASPPHKQNISMPSAMIRWKMLKEGLKNYKNFTPCDIEIKREGYSWTIETVKELRKNNKNLDLFFIIGSESFIKIKTWKSYSQLLEEINFIVLLREENHLRIIKNLSKELDFQIYEDIKKCKKIGSVIPFKYSSSNILLSSTSIRNMIENKKNPEEFLPQEVYKIIKENGLYERKD